MSDFMNLYLNSKRGTVPNAEPHSKSKRSRSKKPPSFGRAGVGENAGVRGTLISEPHTDEASERERFFKQTPGNPVSRRKELFEDEDSLKQEASKMLKRYSEEPQAPKMRAPQQKPRSDDGPNSDLNKLMARQIRDAIGDKTK